MKSTFIKANYWNWILSGSIVAPLFILLFSILRNEITMRSPAILISIAVIGGIAGRTIYSLNEYEKKNDNSGRSGRIVRNLVVYLLIVLLGFVLLRVGPF